jgi:hypothetical protein
MFILDYISARIDIKMFVIVASLKYFQLVMILESDFVIKNEITSWKVNLTITLLAVVIA